MFELAAVAMNERFLTIGDRTIGLNQPCFIIAEAGVNHNGDPALALELIDVAAAAGADAVKFQTFVAGRLATSDAPKAAYQIETTGSEESQLTMLSRLELSADTHLKLFEQCRRRGIIFLSTPFDEQSADLLFGLGVCAFKTPSGELTNLRYLAHVARFGLPMIVSTGMATLREVALAVETIETAGNPPLALLHCVSNYPASPADVNLRAMATLERAFGVCAGYSDHTMGVEIATAAAALGACIIEKHFTVDRTLPGPDHRASLEPDELAHLVRAVRNVEAAMGDGRKRPAYVEAATAAAGRKSLIAARDIRPGHALTDDDVTAQRPGTGLAPDMRAHVLGRRSKGVIRAGTLLALEMLA